MMLITNYKHTKINIIIILILVTAAVMGQTYNNGIENLSYHVVGIIENKTKVGGTGFFIKKGTKFYLVSAWHCFSHKNHLTQKWNSVNSEFIREMIVYRNLADIGTNNYSRIELINSITNQPVYSSIYYKDELLDISAIQINRQRSFEFDYYDVDSIDRKITASINDNVLYYGFPIKNGSQSDSAKYFAGNVSEINLERKELVAYIKGHIGCSGAPLFLKIGENKYLWGVLFYALKDETGKGERCKAVDLNLLIEKL